METGLGCLIAVLSITIAPILQGMVFAQMWHWFAVPTFRVNDVSVPAAIGLAELVGLLTYQFIPRDTAPDEKQKKDRYLQAAGMAFVYPLFILFVGWIVQHWMQA